MKVVELIKFNTESSVLVNNDSLSQATHAQVFLYLIHTDKTQCMISSKKYKVCMEHSQSSPQANRTNCSDTQM